MKKPSLFLAFTVLMLNANAQNFPKSRTSEYKATVLTTNFNVPVVRFNRIKDDPTKRGDVSLFNSIGAGVSVNAGRLSITADDKGQAINTELSNTFGVQIGALFAANTGEEQVNVFALTMGVNILDLTLGYGYEFGTTAVNQRRGFATLAYSIPLSKLTKKGFRILTRSAELSEDKKSVNPGY